MRSSTRITRRATRELDSIRTSETAARSIPAGAPGPTPPGMVVLGRYRLHRPLGTGGFATVWLARDERLERDVAVKLLARERVRGRFEREARAAARLAHPGIVTLYEAAVDDKGAYLVSELVRGSTLDRLLETGLLSDRDVVAIGVALCDALEHAHAHGVVHRDVKPSNVLVPDHPGSPGELAKLTDFGVARLIGGNTLTHTGDVLGTAAYMAPEQAEGREADAAADLYSSALVCYEALTGRNPVATGPGATPARRSGAHLPPLRRHRRDLPRELGAAIDLALRPRPRERGTVAELRAALEGALDEVEDLPGIIESPWPARPRKPRIEPDWSAHAGIRVRPPARPPARPPDSDPSDPKEHRRRFRWPGRMVAGAGGALATALLVWTAFVSPPLAPVGAAIIAFFALAAFPRLGWVALVVAIAIGLSAQGRSGVALVVALGGAIPIVLLPGTPSRWPLGVAAPALGAVSVAGGWPALAGRERTAWRRAALGALGWIWVLLAGLVVGHGVYSGLPAGVPGRQVWAGSVGQTLRQVIWPLFASGLLLPAVVWGLGAVVLPWILRGPVALQVVLVTIWSAALASTTATWVHAIRPAVALGSSEVVLGAVAGSVVALIPTLLARRQSRFASSDTAAGLA